MREPGNSYLGLHRGRLGKKKKSNIVGLLCTRHGTGCFTYITCIILVILTYIIHLFLCDHFLCDHLQFSSVQSLSRVRLFATPWIAAPRPPCPSPTAGVHSNSRPSSRWCHPAISSSVVPFSSWPQSLGDNYYYFSCFTWKQVQGLPWWSSG